MEEFIAASKNVFRYNSNPESGILSVTYVKVNEIWICVQSNTLSEVQIQQLRCILYEHYVKTGVNPKINLSIFPITHTTEYMDDYFNYIARLIPFKDTPDVFTAE